MYARILVEIDISKGLLEMISVASTLGSWNILLDYKGIPFHCRKCHKASHLSVGCSASKSRPKMPPSWWKGVSKDHYTIHKVLAMGDDDSLHDNLVVDSSTIFVSPSSPIILIEDPPMTPLVVSILSLDSIVPLFW